jgi:hypothetical protein
MNRVPFSGFALAAMALTMIVLWCFPMAGVWC